MLGNDRHLLTDCEQRDDSLLLGWQPPEPLLKINPADGRVRWRGAVIFQNNQFPSARVKISFVESLQLKSAAPLGIPR